jgi:hypothetical protein
MFFGVNSQNGGRGSNTSCNNCSNESDLTNTHNRAQENGRPSHSARTHLPA